MIRLSFAAGEKPEPLAHTYLDADGGPVDLTGYNVRATWQHTDGTTGELTGSTSGSDGTATVTLPSTPLATPGVLDVVVWAGNGTERLASPIYRLSIFDPPHTAPSI